MLKQIIFFALVAISAAEINGTYRYAYNFNEMKMQDSQGDRVIEVLESETFGNTSYIVRTVLDEYGNAGVEYLRILTIAKNYMEGENHAIFDDDDEDDLHYSPNDSLQMIEDDRFNSSRARRGLSKRCQKFSDVACYISDTEGKLFFKISYKIMNCIEDSTNKIRFRFKSRLPGTYVLRISAVSGSYVVVIRTYKKFQAVSFLWPRRSAHLGKLFKVYLMVLPHSACSLFDGSFSWSRIKPEEILCNGSSDFDDFGLIFKQKNVALLEQMARFDNSRYVKIASSNFDLSPVQGGCTPEEDC